jgi:hypothetical protein
VQHRRRTLKDRLASSALGMLAGVSLVFPAAALAHITPCEQTRTVDGDKIVLEAIDLGGPVAADFPRYAARVLEDQMRSLSEHRWLRVRLINCWSLRLKNEAAAQPPDVSDFNSDFLSRLDSRKVRAYMWGAVEPDGELRLEFVVIPVIRHADVPRSYFAKYRLPIGQERKDTLLASLRGAQAPLLFAALGSAKAILLELERTLQPRPLYEGSTCWPDAVVTLLTDVASALKRVELDEFDAKTIADQISEYKGRAQALARKEKRCASGIS